MITPYACFLRLRTKTLWCPGFLSYNGSLVTPGFLRFFGSLPIPGFLLPHGSLSQDGFLTSFGSLIPIGFLSHTGYSRQEDLHLFTRAVASDWLAVRRPHSCHRGNSYFLSLPFSSFYYLRFQIWMCPAERSPSTIVIFPVMIQA